MGWGVFRKFAFPLFSTVLGTVPPMASCRPMLRHDAGPPLLCRVWTGWASSPCPASPPILLPSLTSSSSFSLSFFFSTMAEPSHGCRRASPSTETSRSRSKRVNTFASSSSSSSCKESLRGRLHHRRRQFLPCLRPANRSRRCRVRRRLRPPRDEPRCPEAPYRRLLPLPRLIRAGTQQIKLIELATSSPSAAAVTYAAVSGCLSPRWCRQGHRLLLLYVRTRNRSRSCQGRRRLRRIRSPGTRHGRRRLRRPHVARVHLLPLRPHLQRPLGELRLPLALTPSPSPLGRRPLAPDAVDHGCHGSPVLVQCPPAYELELLRTTPHHQVAAMLPTLLHTRFWPRGTSTSRTVPSISSSSSSVPEL